MPRSSRKDAFVAAMIFLFATKQMVLQGLRWEAFAELLQHTVPHNQCHCKLWMHNRRGWGLLFGLHCALFALGLRRPFSSFPSQSGNGLIDLIIAPTVHTTQDDKI
jgi:hypothetical protein